MQARATDSTVYYSCDDHFSQVDNDNDIDQVLGSSQDLSCQTNEVGSSFNEAASNREGIVYIMWLLSKFFNSECTSSGQNSEFALYKQWEKLKVSSGLTSEITPVN